MPNLLPKLEDVRAELSRRREKEPVELASIFFEKQRPFGVDGARFQTACTTRRAGKTYACAAKLIAVAKAKAGCVAQYLTLSRKNSKVIVWETLLELNREQHLGGKDNATELSLRFRNGSTVRVSGVNNETKIEDYRGLPYGLCIIDEAQSFPAYLGKLIDEAIAPGLMDYNGSLAMVGTPGPAPIGYFWEACNNSEWAHHAWTAFDNPYLKAKGGKTAEEHLAEELKRRGVTVEDPVIQREWFGRWLRDERSLVLLYGEKNHYTVLPTFPAQWQYVFGVDLGWDDADAIAVLAWNECSPDLWLVEESVLSKQTITQLGERLKAMVAKYEPIATVIDAGALGKKIAEELRQRWGLNLEAAEKSEKLMHLEFLNDALRSGRFHARRDSRFADDCGKLQWDRTDPQKPRVDEERFHSDIADAVLYPFRRALHWLHEPPPDAQPQPGHFGAMAMANVRAIQPPPVPTEPETNLKPHWNRQPTQAELVEHLRRQTDEEEGNDSSPWPLTSENLT